MAKRVKLNQFCEKVATIATSYNGTIDYIDISAVDNKSKSITSTQTINSIEAPSRAKQLIKNGDVLVSTVRPNLNAVAYVDLETSNLLVASTGYCVLRFTEDLDARYAFYFCQSPYFIDDMVAQATGASYPAVSTSIVKSSMIPLYVKKQQQRIAAVLDKVSELIDLRKRQLAKLDELVKSRFIELLGDPLLDDGRYPKVPLGTLAEVGSSKRIFEKEYVSEGVPFYRTKEIVELSKGNRITTELFITRDRYDEIRDEYGVPQKGDLLISAVGTIGVIWIVDGKNDFYFKDGNLLRVAATERFAPTYIKHLLEALIGAYKQEMSSGTAYAALTISALKDMLVYEVPITEQEQFAAFVEQTDKSKLTVQQSLDKLETLKKSLMQEYFG